VPLPPDLIDELAEVGKIRRVPSNMVVAHEGENGEAFCVVKQGTLRVMLTCVFRPIVTARFGIVTAHSGRL
jgi:CRP-like cAMP-binding protein